MNGTEVTRQRAAAATPDGAGRTQRGGLQVTTLRKAYGSQTVVDGVTLAVPPGEFHALLGPSGSGKTTVLRLIAGLLAADAGVIHISGRDVTQAPPEARDIGLVFQNYALFPHMSVHDNVDFGLRARRVSRAERRQRVAATLDLVGLSGLDRRRPRELSGGQQQRVALARALVVRPQLLLLDEPLSALDRKIRGELRDELLRIQAETDVTALIVTHDQEEALALAQRVYVLDHGQLIQSGAGQELYERPASLFVAGFLGAVNVLPGTMAARGSLLGVDLGGFFIALADDDYRPAAISLGPGAACVVAVRPEKLEVVTEPSAASPDPMADTSRCLTGTVRSWQLLGPAWSLTAALGDTELRATGTTTLGDLRRAHRYAPGSRVTLRIPPGSALVFPDV